MLERLPQRFLHPRVARAITSPSGILLAGAGMSAGILLGAPVALAAAIGAAAYAARVAVAVPKQPAGPKIDPSAVSEPWRSFIRSALSAQARFQRTLAAEEPGPIRDRLAHIGGRLDAGVRECWSIVRRGDNLDDAIRQLDIRRIEGELAQVDAERHRAAHDPRAMEALDRTRRAIASQLESARRVRSVAQDAHNRLRVLTAQMDETVARAVELSLQTGDVALLSPLDADVEGIVVELESLRQAMEETGGGTSSSGAPG